MARSRVIAFAIEEFKDIIPPTLFFAIGFNIIVVTTQLVLDDYLVQIGSFLIATTGALVVGKAVLLANAMPFLRRFDRAPLIQPILFKTLIYFAVVFVVRVLEKIIEYGFSGGTLSAIPQYVTEHFSWHRFAAIQIWIFVLFLIYVTATELNTLFGDGELAKVFFTRRSSELRLTRRQRIRTLVNLSRLADAHSLDELADQDSAAHRELVSLIGRLAIPKAS
ncbi:hypothetical protein SAMN05444161_7817 [Rhizobiales bacterium GAS191]|jgi:hypothetical protein|nr:hypothetical protein SAMN05519103_07108 [Rhizobiales bacterium GAS113]SED49776.1 hypothetical protein SAMN05519104_3672 [Rhizobiales bacterium GAS188]SEE91548.1 hypothetical protein SAMN05444161_7817 [Rhizobiales bacterium GAS191]